MPESLKLSGILLLFACFTYLRKNEQNKYYEKRNYYEKGFNEEDC